VKYPGAARAVANALKADPEANRVAVLGHFARAFCWETSKTVLDNRRVDARPRRKLKRVETTRQSSPHDADASVGDKSTACPFMRTC
jgi:hypothetical protein